jgi:hypothetical protein
MQSIFPLSPPVDLSPVVAEVDRRLGARLRRFAIKPCDDGIALTGRAPSFYVKQLAQHAVQRLTPLTIVRNDIEVL